MDWTPTSVALSRDPALALSSPINLVFKSNGSIVAKTDDARIFETVNRAAWNRATSEAYGFDTKKSLQHFGTRSTGAQASSRPAQVHLSCAREVLDKRRKLSERSQDIFYRMQKKRKIHHEEVEIRKTIDRPTKRQCDERTRYLSELDGEPITCEIDVWRLPNAPSVLTARLKPLCHIPTETIEASASWDYEGVKMCVVRSSASSRTTRKSPLSQCHTLAT